MRLQSYLARAGISSRRSVIEELEAGNVKVNGQVVRIPSYPIFPEKDEILYLDKPVTLSNKVYFLFNKPKGVITTTEDTHGRKTVLHYFRSVKERIYPVGRLDQDTTGLLLLTNDGDLTNQLTHPRYGVRKIYEAVLERVVTSEELKPLEQGVWLEGDDAKTAPCRIKILSARDGKSKVEAVLQEGRKREVRLLFQSIGAKVIHLHRKRYGPLTLKGLAAGKYRPLTDSEVELLRKSATKPKEKT